MTFRRSKKAAQDAEKWRRFLQHNHALFTASGLPIHLVESRDAFDHFLMHGHHPVDPSAFAVERLDAARRTALIELVVRYLGCGFADPGIDGLFDRKTIDEIRRRARID